MSNRIWTVFLLLGASACASSSVAVPHLPVAPAEPEASTPAITAVLAAAVPVSSEAATDKSAATELEEIPTACEREATMKDAPLCLPRATFTEKLCSGLYPEVALHLFSKGTPFTRAYLAGNVEAWNASGGRTHRDTLAFDEEVIVLSKRAPATGGIVMTNASASYDVLRMDGQCMSLMDGELTMKRPPVAKPAEIPFYRLEEATRHALTSASKIKPAYEAAKKACNTVGTPAQKASCEKAQRNFSRALADGVRTSSIELPVPLRRP